MDKPHMNSLQAILLTLVNMWSFNGMSLCTIMKTCLSLTQNSYWHDGWESHIMSDKPCVIGLLMIKGKS